jgi:hypothetical protein
LGYRPPEEFEQAAHSTTPSQGATMRFFRHPEVFRSDVRFLIEGGPTEAGSPDHRLDESPAGYSLAGWSPPEPASASPAEDHFEGEKPLRCAGLPRPQLCDPTLVGVGLK